MSSEASTPDITRTECARCRTEVYGVEGRYSCTGCGWVNHYSDGHNELPAASADADYPNPLTSD
ncbi:hypothetical protein AB0886_05155 [Streptomyces sp. NPDC024062]|uniref:hypothetical protein n=1 Tax=unclassified Streptomyces TaxID=2593676 RepID=UPI0034375E5C